MYHPSYKHSQCSPYPLTSSSMYTYTCTHTHIQARYVYSHIHPLLLVGLAHSPHHQCDIYSEDTTLMDYHLPYTAILPSLTSSQPAQLSQSYPCRYPLCRPASASSVQETWSGPWHTSRLMGKHVYMCIMYRMSEQARYKYTHHTFTHTNNIVVTLNMCNMTYTSHLP